MRAVAAVVILLAAVPLILWLASWAPLLVARRRGLRLGVRGLGRAALTAAGRVDTVVLDKHRTVTTGELRVVSVDPVDPDHNRNLRWFAGALEHASQHRVARAIARLSGVGRLTGVEELPGCGITGSVDRHPVRVGDPEWIGLLAPDRIGITVAVAVDARPLGHITVADEIRADAPESVASLRELEIEPVLMSDDTAANTRHVAELVGIDRSCADADPRKRAQLVRNLTSEGRTVAVVADPREDRSALELAALRLVPALDEDAGCEPVQQPQLVLDDLDIAVVSHAIRLCRSALARRSRCRFAVGAPLVAVPFGATSLITPLLAAVIAAAAAVVVTGIALLPVRSH